MNQQFIKKHCEELTAILQYYKQKLEEQILPFWEPRVVDMQYGGYFNCFDAKGELYSTVKPGWFVGRTMYTFSYLYNTYKRNPKWLEIATQGRSFLEKAALSNGRFCQMLAQDGTPITGATSIFTDHFAVKGLYEYIIATGKTNPRDIEWARQLTDQLFDHILTPSVLQDEMIPDGMQKHAVCFMTLLVALESKHLFGNAYSSVLRDCIHRSLYVFANDTLQAPFEYVGTDGMPVLRGEGRLIDPGHTLESMWFAMRAGQEEGTTAYAQRAKIVIDWVLHRAWDETYGGFYQHVDVENTTPEERFLTNTYVDVPVLWDDKIWWVQAEGLYALLMSSLENGADDHFAYFMKLHRFVKEHFMDEEVGEWNSVCHRNGEVSDARKGFELKGPYHVVRCHVQIVQLLQQALQDIK
ncbi:AGE family epimerase/isomerase [Hydrogenoanaerobacterium sp.]|uniref:AGE family epimerase/isomerase n=1 Tax=Hydrogenoanaerobacterium sp. TaxID=2953763 RepID=UPI00289C7FC1|nr:AGE family epimerase/isomerase [Hydrogenoanaerobacterium sp.]